MLLTRSLFSQTEPPLRKGERVIASYTHPTVMTEYTIGRDVTTRAMIRAYARAWADLMPPLGYVPMRRRKRVGAARHNGRMAKRRR